jgi:inner membrane protein
MAVATCYLETHTGYGNDLMCSVLTHPAVPIALSTLFPQEDFSSTVLLAGAACSVIPDLDVIGLKFGIRSPHMLGHRGLTHSIAFAAALGAVLTYTLFRHNHPHPWVVFLFLFVSTLSHALLDMLTNGGQGVALWAPFSNTRYFFPWRPIEVSPIGVRRFFSARGVQIIQSELRWVWLPSAGAYILGMLLRRYG